MKVLGWFLGILGALGVLLLAPTIARFATVIVRSGGAPRATTVAAAPPDTWVRLTDAVLRCDTRRTFEGRTTAFLGHDAQGAHPFVASFVGDLGCAQAQADVNGVFMPGTADPERLARVGLDVGGSKDYRFLSQALRPAAMKVALVRGIAWLVAAVLLVVAGVVLVRRARRAPAA